LVTLTLCFWQASASAATILKVANPIVDKNGRVAVIVDFSKDADESYGTAFPTNEIGRVPASFHRPSALRLVEDYERRFNFTRVGMTSWVGISVTAFVTPEQMRALAADSRVSQITEDRFEEFSAPLPWADSQSTGGEMNSWGRYAVNGKTLLPNSNRKVFIIDGGVALHADLSSVVSRTNVACGGSGNCEFVLPTAYPVVGCYAHATHVAGIIGASSGNDITSSGVYSGVKMVSVSVIYDYANSGACSNSLPTTSSVGYALDYVFQQNLTNNGGMVGIVNISINGGGMGWVLNGASNFVAEPNYSKVRQLATPALLKGGARYQGALVVQSAGNFFENVCTLRTQPSSSHAYMPVPIGYPNNAALPDDGIMVVGAVNADGLAVQPSQPFAPTVPAGITGVPLPSNYGKCVDVWAPGDRIVSTWGNHATPNTLVGPTYTGNAYGTISGWAFLSGTSMAAPHVAAAAAYFADAYALTTPAQIEQYVRQYAVKFNGAVDASGEDVKTVQLQ
jgi:subtilisin family serine protease